VLLNSSEKEIPSHFLLQYNNFLEYYFNIFKAQSVPPSAPFPIWDLIHGFEGLNRFSELKMSPAPVLFSLGRVEGLVSNQGLEMG